MNEISPQIFNLLTSYSEFTGQNYPLRGQRFRHEGRELNDLVVLSCRVLSGVDRHRIGFLNFPLFVFLSPFFENSSKQLLITMKDQRFLFQQKRNSKIGLCDSLALPVYYTINKNYRFHIESL